MRFAAAFALPQSRQEKRDKNANDDDDYQQLDPRKSPAFVSLKMESLLFHIDENSLFCRSVIAEPSDKLASVPIPATHKMQPYFRGVGNGS